MKFDFSKYTILTIGDVILDSYTFGTVDRISPEAPVPVIKVQKTEFKLGGAANVASNISANKAQSILLGFKGNDVYGQNIEQLCQNENIIFKYINSAVPSIVKNRIIARGQHIVRIDHEQATFLSIEKTNQLDKLFKEIIGNERIDGIIIQDYNKGALPPAFIELIITQANDNNIPTVVDPKFNNLTSFKNCSIFKPNQLEFNKAISHFNINHSLTIYEKCSQLQKEIEFDKIYITLGAQGIYSFKLDKIFPTISSELVDITGAGDSLVACLILMHLHKLEEEEICINLNIIGSQVIQKIGTVSFNINSFFGEN